MGIPSDDVVVIQKAKRPGEPCVITVNCPDKTGLGCDICRIILDFGLYIKKADFSTDGIWCYLVLWVVPNSSSTAVKWSNLEKQLLSVCPSCSVPYYFYPQPTCSSPAVYLLKFLCSDRYGLLHDVTEILSDLELAIQMVKVTTTPDDRVLDLFFITDNMELLHTKERQDKTLKQLQAVLGESCTSCELQLVGPEYDPHHGISSLSPVVAEELFRCELLDKEIRSQALSPDMAKLKNANVTIDNSLSPAHTLLQIHCVDHKGLFYDIMRTLKDGNIKIAYGRFSPATKGYRDLDLFIQRKDGKKIQDPERQSVLCLNLKVEMLHPLRVIIANRGPDTELLVANPVEKSGKGRPLVFFDVTRALKALKICIFSAEIGRRISAADREWEVYSFLLEENTKFQFSNMAAKNQIVDREEKEVGIVIIRMPQGSFTPRSSAYLDALTQEIEKKLQRALASPSLRRNLLQELFTDIALEIDERAKDIILSGEDDAISPAEDCIYDQLCFHDVLADYYVWVPESGKRILDLIVQLWSQSFASHIFALLFHKWLFEVQLDNSEVLLRFSSALVQGATNVFWIDIQSNMRRFESLFIYLLEDVALESTRLNKIPVQVQRDLYLLLSRFIFFYNKVDKLESFFRQLPVFPNAFLVGGPADFFVIELADQLQKLKVEPVLLHYFSHIKVLQGMELRMATSTRLKTCLYSFTSPGGPMYPTRVVRHAAWDALDFLFPVGRYPRHLISLFFRLLYPWYWPSSCWNFVMDCIKAVLYSLFGLIYSSLEKLKRPKF
ncbi:hypothetical protein ACLB2K_029922 [Fragaria x ananassa]